MEWYHKMEGKKEKKRLSLEEFKKVLEIFKVMLSDKNTQFSFSKYSFSIQLDMSKLIEKSTSYKINVELVKEGHTEISNLLNHILRDKERSFLERYSKKEAETIKKKCGLIEKELINQELIEKFVFQTTCKNYLFDSFDWEVIKHDGKEGKETYSTVMMQIKLRNPSREIVRPPLSPKEDTKFVTFECNNETIDELMGELKKIKERLNENA